MYVSLCHDGSHSNISLLDLGRLLLYCSTLCSRKMPLSFRSSGFASPFLVFGGLLRNPSICLHLGLFSSHTISHVSIGEFHWNETRSKINRLDSYNLRQKDVAPVDVGFHRAIAVTAGTLWAMLVSRFWWPSEARRELSKSLSEFRIVYNPGC